ncbi:MAG: potassium-transporting ATPase subunit KdpA [Thermoplasmata archaeon]
MPGLSSFADLALLLLLVLAAAPFVGAYLARVFANRPAPGDRFWNPIESALYRLMGVDPRRSMRWQEYAGALVLTVTLLVAWIWIVLTLQADLPWNPAGLPGFSWDLAFHTAASFATNTDFTHFTNEAQLSLGAAVLSLQVALFLSAGTGLAVVVAFIRGFTSRDGTLGNFYADLVRSVTRFLLPAALLGALVLVALDLPETFTSSVLGHGLGGIPQRIYLGPVASWTSIELLGTNGGGWYAANAANTLANPSAASSLVQTGFMLLLPFSIPFLFGRMVRRPSEAYPYLATILIVLLLALGLFLYFQYMGNPALAGVAGIDPGANGYPIGQQSQFSAGEASLFQVVSVYTNTGASNMLLGSLPAGSQMVLVFGMFTQSTPGGVGTGFGTLLVFALVGVFLAGLMVGRTPEYLGKKVGKDQMKWSAATLILHPALVLLPVLGAYLAGLAGPAVGAPGGPVPVDAHQFTILLYEFTSEAANNGSAMGPIADATPFFNVLGGVVMLVGRLVPMVAMLAIGSLFARQEPIPASVGTLRTSSATFTIYLTLIVIVVSGLLFLPVLALGPLAQGGW